MPYSPNNLTVAKFGGTSMAQPDIVRQRVQEHQPSVVVVSAAGKDPGYRTKMTDHLLEYAENPSRHLESPIIRRMSEVALHVLPLTTASELSAMAVRDLAHAVDNDDSVAALGEKWSAETLAAATDYEFVDARELIQFSALGVLDSQATDMAIRDRLDPRGQYVVPGFYGSLPDGRTTTFERGGSDITGAIVARALNASAYQNWSDVEGYYSTNPREYAGARPVANLSYLESRELANGGSELLHPEVAKGLGNTSIVTALYSTFSGRSATSISSERAQWHEIPIVGISGRQHMLELRLSQFGIEEEAGTTSDLYDALRDAGIPYRHAATSVDNLALYLDGSHTDALMEMVSDRSDMSLSDTSMLHIVGEAMAHDPQVKMAVIVDSLGALARHSIAVNGMTDIGATASTTLFVNPADYIKSLGLLHHRLIESATPVAQ